MAFPTGPVARRLCAAAGIVAMTLWTAPCALAEPGDPAGGAVVDAPTLSWPDLGAPGTLSFYGETSTTALSFPVPPGVTPVALNAVVDLPFPMRSGVLTVMQENRLISKVGLPLADLAPLVIPLPGVEVIDGTVTLSLTLSGLAEDRFCLDYLNPVDLVDGSVTFAGREAPPTTVADFLPAILRKLTIAVPAQPSQAESNAAVRLATSMVARYRIQAPEVRVVPLAAGSNAIDAPSLPLERQFIVKEGPEEGLSIQGTAGVPQMLVSGPGDRLVNQVQLLSDSSLGIAVGPRAVAEKLHTGPSFPGNSVTLAQLSQQLLTASGAAPQVSIGLDQTRFGHSTQAYRLHLLGSYTPLPSTIGGQLVVSVNGETVDAWPAESGGVIDRWVNIPDRLIARYTNVQVALNTTGNTGRCNEYRASTLTLNGASVVESSPAIPPVPTGFGSLPQALMPTMQIGIAAESFADTVRAIHLATGLQRLSVMPLQTQVTSVEQALTVREPAIVIAADGWTDESITLPVSAEGGSVTVDGAAPGDPQTTLALDPGISFGSLQTVFDGRRSLLIATSNGAPAQLDELLSWLDSEPGRWTRLAGNALVAFPGRAPASVSSRSVAGVSGPALSDVVLDDPRGSSSAWWIAAAVVAVAAAGTAGITVTARRERSGRQPADPRL